MCPAWRGKEKALQRCLTVTCAADGGAPSTPMPGPYWTTGGPSHCLHILKQSGAEVPGASRFPPLGASSPSSVVMERLAVGLGGWGGEVAGWYGREWGGSVPCQRGRVWALVGRRGREKWLSNLLKNRHLFALSWSPDTNVAALCSP